MASGSVFVQSELAILDRLIRAEKAGLSVAAARSILKIDFEPADRERMHQLAVKARDGTLTAAEQAEIDAYEVVGHLLGLMHSKARLSLKGKGVAEDEVCFLEEQPRAPLSDRDRDAFLALLDNPPPPNEALQRAAEKYKKRYR